ncbi:nitrilase-related carbon-nitrogen hydrolase [Roseovarius sp. MMSF_3281]|uniref:nitrilase-related carbon-nitrogen hydrolase n=1 Tax=Roseovarius sp. MMSF_3281 TaxID=3046694 RepID=UPI00273D4226|nr:nitrilase-related carbon-nitrogen hydrolase [Roseovarius sp. MMSF_3281]
MKLGVYQCRDAGLSTAERLAKVEKHITGQALDLVLCPELFPTGYNPTLDYGALSEPSDGPFAQAMARLARNQGTAIAYGYPERAGDTLYNSAALIGATGTLLANHRKRLPSPQSFEAVTFAKGPSVTFADLCGLRVAIIICYEVEFPESLRQAAQGGAHLVLVPTALGADWGVVAEKMVPTRAFENGVWLAYADHAGEEGGLAFFGGSRIVAPDGQDVAVVGPGREGLITSDVDVTGVVAAQARLPYLKNCLEL